MTAANPMAISAPVPASASTSGTMMNTEDAGVAADSVRNKAPNTFMLRCRGFGLQLIRPDRPPRLAPSGQTVAAATPLRQSGFGGYEAAVGRRRSVIAGRSLQCLHSPA